MCAPLQAHWDHTCHGSRCPLRVGFYCCYSLQSLSTPAEKERLLIRMRQLQQHQSGHIYHCVGSLCTKQPCPRTELALLLSASLKQVESENTPPLWFFLVPSEHYLRKLRGRSNLTFLSCSLFSWLLWPLLDCGLHNFCNRLFPTLRLTRKARGRWNQVNVLAWVE